MKILSVLLLLLLSSGYSQYYLWPTNSGFYLTSTFCEFRVDHYHSGIDIKTWNKEGYPCYAIEDGYIDRIRVSPFGYGKVIYLHLNDDNYAVYAHLQRFTKKIDDIIRKEQLKNKKYRIVWRPKKKIKVKKGEIIGYTGSTGIGTPHLHFEIRDKDDNPVNALQYYIKHINDEIAPSLQKISVIPVSKNSIINGSYLPRTFLLEYLKDGIYIIKEPLYVRGNVGLAIKLYDQAYGRFNKFSFYTISMNIAGEEVFHICYDTFDFAHTRYINSAIYYPFWVEYKEVFYKLFKEVYNPLGFYKQYPNNNSIIKIFDKPVTFSIFVTDYNGNMSTIKGELIPDIDKSLEINRIVCDKRHIHIGLIADHVRDIKFTASKNRMNWDKIDSCKVENREDNSKMEYSVDLYLQDSLYNTIQLNVESDFKKVIHRNIYLRTDSLVEQDYINVQPGLHILTERFILNLDNFYYDSRLKIMPYDTIMDLKYVSDGNYQVQIPLELMNSDTLMLEVLSGDQTIWADSFQIRKFNAGERNSYSWYDSSLIITSKKKSFFCTSFLTTKLVDEDSIKKITPVASKIYHIMPDDLPLYRNIHIKIKADSSLDSMNWSIYNIEGKNKLTYVNTEFDSLSRQFSANIGSTGKYIVAADTIAPEIHIESPNSGEVYHKDPEIKFFINDSISGIGNEKDISISLDGNFILPEWDPEEDLVIARFDESLEIGRHTLEIVVQDNAGNTTKKYVFFTIQ